MSINNTIITVNIAFNSYFIRDTGHTSSNDVRGYGYVIENHAMTNDNYLEWMWRKRLWSAVNKYPESGLECLKATKKLTDNTVSNQRLIFLTSYVWIK